MYIQTKSKYNAVRTTYGGHSYDSRFEASYAGGLDTSLKAGNIASYESHVPLELKVKGETICRYKIDFVVNHLDGSHEFVETKGFWTPYAKLKFKLFEALFEDFKRHPDDSITVVKQSSWGPPKRRI